MRATVGVIIEFPEMYKLIDRTGVALEISDKLLILPALLERRKADLLIELHRLCHLSDMQRVGSQFVKRHRKSSIWVLSVINSEPRSLRTAALRQRERRLRRYCRPLRPHHKCRGSCDRRRA